MTTTQKTDLSIEKYTVIFVSVMVNSPITATGNSGVSIASIANQATFQWSLSYVFNGTCSEEAVK